MTSSESGDVDHGMPSFLPETEVYRYPAWSIVALIVSYLLVFVVGIVGNASVVIVILKNPQISKTATNLYVANLAVADFLVVTVCLLPTLISNIYVRKSPYFCILCNFKNFITQ